MLRLQFNEELRPQWTDVEDQFSGISCVTLGKGLTSRSLGSSSAR